ncbi:MAG TPA: phenylalanine--tRNA ligase subunit beta [Candidatus Methylomirabilis sp.]|nr:phenylalanine--tRNA ligase subunit beta [Candidatus Methylomirabilis sp.]
MKVSFNWLRELVEVVPTPVELADRLTMAGLEVEGVEEIRPTFTQVVVGRIQAIDPPPRGERVSLCRVDVGKTVVPILCGAPKIAVGLRVAVALPGAELPGGRQIQETLIGGARSVGMLCSEKELGLGEDGAGLLILDERATPGVDLAQALQLHDHILEVAVTANRGDCLSHWGMAREVAAVTGAALRLKAVRPREGTTSIQDLAAVTVNAADLCPRYAARVIQGVSIGSSPFWLRRRLVLSGLRPINNVVDATNYVLLEMGQPLHAFDHARLEGGRIVVRRAVKGERIVTLDGVERPLEPGMLVIADAVRPVAIAGVMGGLATEVTGTTKNLLLESALFQPVSVRRTAKALTLSSESSYRFERGVDPEGVDRALDRVAALIVGLAGGQVARGLIDVQAARRRRTSLRLRVERVRQVLGGAVALPEVGRVLKRIQCRVKPQGSKVLAVAPPSHRLDLTREIDLVEEVARLRGFDQIPTSRPASEVRPAGVSSFWGIERQMRRLLTAWGFQETVNFSFTREELLDKLRLPADDPRRHLLRIRNPLGGEAVLRSILLPSLLENLVLNESRGSRDAKLFEIARVFRPQPGAAAPVEVRTVSVVAAGDRLPAWWGTKGEKVDFYDLKGVVETLDKIVGVSLTLRASADIPYLHPGQQAEIALEKDVVGSVGVLHPEVMRNFDLKTAAVAMEIDLDRLDRHRKPQARYCPLPRYPAVFRDMAVVVPERMRAAEVESAIRRAGGALVEAVRPFDVYRGEPVPEGKKSLGFSIQYRATDRTLTDEEVAAIHGKILEAVERDLGGILR